ncbi:MAG: hypothetical protein LRY31_01050 [Burkholderiaceae bacterium]|nr:hypothetical protein [Burkholderiaceae bacterium]
MSEVHEAPVKVSRSKQLVLDVLYARQRHGFSDTTDAEIQEMLEQLHAPRRFDRSWVSGRVAELKEAGLVVESEHKRQDAQTRRVAAMYGHAHLVRAVYIPAKQVRLCA